MTFRALAAVLVMWLGQDASSPAEEPPVGRDGMAVEETVVDEDTSLITIRYGPAVTAIGKVMSQMAVTTRLTLKKGFRFVQMVDEQEGGSGAQGTLRLEFFHDVPEGMTVIRLGENSAGRQTDPRDDVVIDAHSLAEAFEEMSPGWLDGEDRSDRSSATVAPDPALEVSHPCALRRASFARFDAGRDALALTPTSDPSDASVALCVATRSDVVFLGSDGSRLHAVSFEGRGHPRPLIDGEGLIGFLSVTGFAVVRYDAGGGLLWTFPDQGDIAAAGDAGPPGVLSSASADLDGDGELEHVVGCNGRGGVFLLDDDGTTVARWDAINVFDVAIVDVEDDAAPEILHVDGAVGGARVRRADGAPLGTRPALSGSFRVVPGADGKPLFASIVGVELRLLDTAMQLVLTRPMTRAGTDEISIAWPTWDDAERPWLAVSRTIGFTGRSSELFVFDPDGHLAWHEEFPFSYLAVATVPATDGARRDLLVAAGQDVWRYELVEDSGR